MARRSIILLTLFFIVSAPASADEVIWSYDLTELPYSWGQYGFVFSSEGAHTHHDGYWYPGMGTRGECAAMLTEHFTITQPMDSLVIHIPQHVYLSAGSSSGSAAASVSLSIVVNGSASTVIWSQSVYGYRGSLEDSLPIHASIANLSAGQFVSFSFSAYHSGYNGYTEVDWWLYQASLTGYGDLNLNQTTWAGIKRSVGEGSPLI